MPSNCDATAANFEDFLYSPSHGGTGTIQLVPNAGSGTYTYAYKLNGTSTWILSSTATITGLGAGSWDIQVTDSNGCTAEELGVVLTEGNSPTAILNNYVAPCTPGPTQFTIIAEDSSGNLINANDYTITNLIDFNSGASVGTWVILGSPANGEYANWRDSGIYICMD